MIMHGETVSLDTYDMFLWTVVNALDLDYDDWSLETLGHPIIGDFERRVVEAGPHCYSVEEVLFDVAIDYLAALKRLDREVS